MVFWGVKIATSGAGDFGGCGEFFLGVHLHLPEGVDRAYTDVEVAAGEDEEEREARDAGLGLAGPEAAEVPDADPDAAGHVAAEGDLDDRQCQAAEREELRGLGHW